MYLEVQQFIIIEVDAHGEVEPGVALIDDLKVVELGKGAVTSRKLVYLDPRATIMRWISDCSLTFSLSS